MWLDCMTAGRTRLPRIALCAIVWALALLVGARIGSAQQLKLKTMEPWQPYLPSPDTEFQAWLENVQDTDAVSNCKFVFDGAEEGAAYDPQTKHLTVQHSTAGYTNASVHSFSFSCTVTRNMGYQQNHINLSTADPYTGEPGYECDCIVADPWIDQCELSDRYPMWYFGKAPVPDQLYSQPQKVDTPVVSPTGTAMGAAEDYRFRFGCEIPPDEFRYLADLSLLAEEPAPPGWPVHVDWTVAAKENQVHCTLPVYVYSHSLQLGLNLQFYRPNSNSWADVPLPPGQQSPYLFTIGSTVHSTAGTPNFPPYLRNPADPNSQQTTPWVEAIAAVILKVVSTGGGPPYAKSATSPAEAAKLLAQHVYVWGGPPDGPSPEYTYYGGSSIYWRTDLPHDPNTWYFLYENTYDGIGGNCEDFAGLIECDLRTLGISAREAYIVVDFGLHDHKLCGSSYWVTGGRFLYHNVPTALSGVHDTALAFRITPPPPPGQRDWRLAAGEGEATYQTDLTPDAVQWVNRFAVGEERLPPWWQWQGHGARPSRVDHYLLP
jgi:hypothetical protein